MQFFYFVKEKLVEFMGPKIVEFVDMFMIFGVCNFFSGNRTVRIIDMVRVLIQNLVWLLQMLESKLPKQFFSVKRLFGKCFTYFTNSLKVLVKFIEFYQEFSQNIFEGVHM